MRRTFGEQDGPSASVESPLFENREEPALSAVEGMGTAPKRQRSRFQTLLHKKQGRSQERPLIFLTADA